MRRILLIAWFVLGAIPAAFAETDQEIMDKIRASAERIFLEQASWTLPESFWKSGLDPADKDRIVNRLAKDRANCFVDALEEYSKRNQIPLSKLASADASIRFEGNTGSEFHELLDPCIQRAWEASGISR